MSREEIKPYRNKGTCEPLETDDMTAIVGMVLDVAKKKRGRVSEYPDTPEGMERFIDTTIAFFEYVNAINSNPDMERKLIPDIENWAMYMGVTRVTLLTYEKRGTEWGQMIGFYKNAIAAVKKQLAMNYKIPPMVYVFDATNNHGYVNSNEFRLSVPTEDKRGVTVDPETIAAKYGLEDRETPPTAPQND